MKKSKENKFNCKRIYVLLIFIGIIIILSFTVGQSLANTSPPNKQLINPKDFIIGPAEIDADIPGFSLPLNIADIENYYDFFEKMPLTPKVLELLEKNAFVVVPTPLDIAEQEVFLDSTRELANPKDDFVAYYQVLKNIDVPVFITSDSLLHYYHIFFDSTLMRLERDLFYQDIWEISKELFDLSLNQ